MNAIGSNFSTRPSELFARFARFVEDEYPSENGAHTVKDLRVAARRDRLIESSVWSFKQLDEIEEESDSYGEETMLANLFPLPATV